MNREIKFRAIVSDDITIYFNLKELLENKFSNREILWNWIKEGNKPDEYTGLKDKNGKEIYEGDIVHMKSEDYVIRNLDFKEVVKIENGLLLPFHEYWRGDRPIDMCNYEVIGNIYENPELCEEK